MSESKTATKPCPFCGDLRPAQIEEVEMKFDPPNMFVASCQCCGAQGPTAITRGAALIEWDERRPPGATKEFIEQSDRLAGFTPTAAPRSCEPDKGVEPMVILKKGDPGYIDGLVSTSGPGLTLNGPGAVVPNKVVEPLTNVDEENEEIASELRANVVSVDRKELEELRADKARLDWLQVRGTTHAVLLNSMLGRWRCNAHGKEYNERHSIRDAIDDSRKVFDAARQPAPPSGRETPK